VVVAGVVVVVAAVVVVSAGTVVTGAAVVVSGGRVVGGNKMSMVTGGHISAAASGSACVLTK